VEFPKISGLLVCKFCYLVAFESISVLTGLLTANVCSEVKFGLFLESSVWS